MNHDEILNNRAVQSQPGGDQVSSDCCGSDVVFALRDKHHDFSMSLSTLLQCLRFAEENGAVPPLEPAWWWQVASRYHLSLHELEKTSYEGEDEENQT